jgi:polysaccharide deacetylase family protein (PEP-CTERM system associated)
MHKKQSVLAQNLPQGSGEPDIINCFSVDVEGFVESNLQSFHIDKKYIDKKREDYEIERNMNSVLELLNELNIQATFFFVGRIARDIPNTVKEAARLGHEIACHSYEHVRAFGTSKDEFKEKLVPAKNYLEDVSGRNVYGFRAPDFSITESNICFLDILKEIGFLYDSSIYPIGMHDVYGIKEAKPHIYKLQNGLIEFPLSTIKFLGRRFPFGGGGYFRLYPLFLTKICISKTNRLDYPCMFYIHPYEVGPIIPKISEISNFRKFRHYYNCKNGSIRLKEILRVFKFGTAIQILKQRNLLEND